ncbi:MAG TPA: hypothetical protein VFW29_12185 [Solirubrobacteraceae bacterium]|nr:hypothetical protein [Solirubrobacteraceae bacterium]
MLTTLLVIVTAVGGPLSAQRNRAPSAPMPGSVIEVEQPSSGLLAMSRFGSIELQLQPSSYVVTARTAPGGRLCGSKTVHLGHRRRTVHLLCSIR